MAIYSITSPIKQIKSLRLIKAKSNFHINIFTRPTLCYLSRSLPLLSRITWLHTHSNWVNLRHSPHLITSNNWPCLCNSNTHQHIWCLPQHTLLIWTYNSLSSSLRSRNIQTHRCFIRTNRTIPSITISWGNHLRHSILWKMFTKDSQSIPLRHPKVWSTYSK